MVTGNVLVAALAIHAAAAPTVPPDARVRGAVAFPLTHERFADAALMDSGYVVIHRGRDDRDSALAVLGGDGKELFSKALVQAFPDASSLNPRTAVLRSDGILVVHAWVGPASGGLPVPWMVEYDTRLGSEVRRFQTTPCTCIEIASSGEDIWCLGPETEKHNAGEDYEFIHRFSLRGEYLGSHFGRSSMPHQGREIWGPTEAGPPAMRVLSNGRVLAWLPSGPSLLSWQGQFEKPKVLPIASIDALLGLPATSLRAAITAEGKVMLLATTGSPAGGRSVLLQVDGNTGEVKLAAEPGASGRLRLLGATESSAILWDDEERRTVEVRLK